MKTLSIIVPCYNSEEYMERCINSLLIGGELVEVIVIDDGSTDHTLQIAESYAKNFPSIVKVVSQANGGHGQAINTGLVAATGKYVKVVDSDDWLDMQAYNQVLDFLQEQAEELGIDMLISNYVYEKEQVKHKKVMHYRSFLPIEKPFSWDEVKFPSGKYLLMHSVIYRLDLLKQLQLQLPQHTFYVDNLYVFKPLPLVERMYYLDVNLYKYYIGREDQSVNEKVMIDRIDQQITINKQLVDYYANNKKVEKSLLAYMRNYLEIITTISSILLIKEGSKESIEKKKELWTFIKENEPDLYKNLKHRFFGIGVHLPGRIGRKTAVGVYRMAQKIYGFN
ncbi:MAG: glycosyltransferase [Tetragenococcus sp.]|nr:glycosyltransferase [Tetragenococcus sp.]